MSIGPHIQDLALAERIATLAATERGTPGFGLVRAGRKVTWLPTQTDVIAAILESAERGTPLTMLHAGELDLRGQRLVCMLRDEGVPYMTLHCAEAGQAAARPGDQNRDMVEMHVAAQPDARRAGTVTVPASEMALSGARVPAVRVERHVRKVLEQTMACGRMAEVTGGVGIDETMIEAPRPRGP